MHKAVPLPTPPQTLTAQQADTPRGRSFVAACKGRWGPEGVLPQPGGSVMKNGQCRNWKGAFQAREQHVQRPGGKESSAFEDGHMGTWSVRFY